jgi:putative hydrolase of HD superfamily
MIKRAFVTEIFRAADMRWWGDKIRPVELRELDRQAHKMTIAYALAKYEDAELQERLARVERILAGNGG